MALLSPFGPFRAFDSNGDPLNGGKLYTYEAGTSTPKATYTNAGGAVSNANPVILDASGYANVWLGTGGYKFILKDSADNTLWTIDDIGGDTQNAFGSQIIVTSSNTTITSAYKNAAIIATAALTLSLPSAASAGQGFYFTIRNYGTTGNITVDPNGAEFIDGASTLTIYPGESAIIICTGVVWYSLMKLAQAGVTTNQISTSGTSGVAFKNSGGTTSLTTGANNLLVTTFAGAADFAKGADIASASTTNIGAATGNFVHVTGTTTITSFGTIAAGVHRIVRFAGVLTLTHNATSLILPGSSNITTAANDIGHFVSEGSGNWRCVAYTRANGLAVVSPTTPFSTSFVSTGQTITAGGSLTIAHGLGAVPKLVTPELVCTSAEGGYSVNDVVPIYWGPIDFNSALTNSGVSCVPDATNLNIRFGSSVSPNTLYVLNKTTGNPVGITNSSWSFIVRAYA